MLKKILLFLLSQKTVSVVKSLSPFFLFIQTSFLFFAHKKKGFRPSS
jgi:hypothetical protein